jgi:hypothetical protein
MSTSANTPARAQRARRVRLAVLGCCALIVGGCGNLPQAWEKGVLAKPAMSFDSDNLESRFAEHIYASKEAAFGGGGVGGAGCGCN